MAPDSTLDATGLQCPMPLLKTKLALRDLSPGQTLEVTATDAGSARDIPRYLEKSPHELVSMSDEGQNGTAGVYTFLISCGV